ncbi:MAG: hypothetical protein LBM65_07585 [Oscillospiraceae bacterium]|jgi:hypothetical protein|nr:hypothetical protein [Oscillospiraceae bacterium]
MTDLKQRVVQIILTKLSAAKTAVDYDLAELAVDETAEYICNYCNIKTVPKELKFCWANMAMDYLAWFATQIQGSNNSQADADTVPKSNFASSIKVGDTQLNFAESSKSQTAINAAGHNMQGVLDKYVLNYQEQLNRFRRVGW